MIWIVLGLIIHEHLQHLQFWREQPPCLYPRQVTMGKTRKSKSSSIVGHLRHTGHIVYPLICAEMMNVSHGFSENVSQAQCNSSCGRAQPGWPKLQSLGSASFWRRFWRKAAEALRLSGMDQQSSSEQSLGIWGVLADLARQQLWSSWAKMSGELGSVGWWRWE